MYDMKEVQLRFFIQFSANQHVLSFWLSAFISICLSLLFGVRLQQVLNFMKNWTNNGKKWASNERKPVAKIVQMIASKNEPVFSLKMNKVFSPR